MSGPDLERASFDGQTAGGPSGSMPAAVDVLLLLVIIGVGAVLRARGLGDYWLNPDEGIYYSTLTKASFAEFWAEVAANAHPPAFYLLLRGVGWFTWDFVALRAVSLVFGVVAIWVFWLVGKELGGNGRSGRVAGLVAAGLLAVNAEAIVLSQVLRPYMLLVAVLGSALYFLLRYVADPSRRNLVAHTAFVTVGLLTHYSAALALGVFASLGLWMWLSGGLSPEASRRFALAQAVPFVVLMAVLVQHLVAVLGSDLMADALDPGGWLSGWLVSSPGEAWASYVSFQIFHAPPGFQGRCALLLLGAVGVSWALRDRSPAVMTATALAIAVGASFMDVYPFGPTRHDSWLVVFTLPSLGWLTGRVVERGGRSMVVAAVVLVAFFAVGGPIERAVGNPVVASPMTNTTEERVILRSEVAPMVVARLDPDSGPALILMTQQTYNVLMPLYAGLRGDATYSADSTAFSFPYGARRVLVLNRWDWDGVESVVSLVRARPGGASGADPAVPSPLLVMAGGWGSTLFDQLPSLRDLGALMEATVATGVDPAGRPVARMLALTLDADILMAAR